VTGHPTAPPGSARIVRAVVRQEPVAFVLALASWTTFHALPVAGGWLLKVVLDRVQADGPPRLVWGALAALAGAEVGRWLVLVGSAWQWHGVWVHWHTVPRVALLRSLLRDPGPAAGRLPGSPGEAVSRFRDDARNLALVADVWLDVTGVAVACAGSLLVLLAVDARAALLVVLPVAASVLLTRRAAGRLTDLRTVEREATAAVTGFIGDAFGAVQAVKAAGAERAVAHRFDHLGRRRADAALRDQVATQALETVSGATGNLSTGLALLLLAPSLAAGEATVGDVGLFASAAGVMAGLPRWVARAGSYTRQADVSVRRAARLLPAGDDPMRIAGPVTTCLRAGPGPFPPVRTPDRAGRADALRRLEVRGLVVRHPDGRGVGPVDLDVAAGEITAITGPVGCGKSTLLRGLLGLVAVEAGEIRWDGEVVADPSTALVPPRAAYLPQVPRLFGEPLRDTVLLGVDPGEDDERLHEALRIACLDVDVAAMPEGLSTVVGARGVRLSGGQVQRAGAARALVRRPDLLVVDDLSSALDVRTEAEVWARLRSWPDRPALLVVSHRPEVLGAADRVVVLGPDGTPVGSGA
jgi:ATP-binding cassette, subfamily B, bacterial